MATDQETTRVGRRKCPSCGLELASSVTTCPRDGTTVKTTINVDPAFANYEFIESIGEGGMGVIYKARHKHLNKVVAVKTLHSHLTNADLIKRFEIEGKAVSILSHPNIIGVQDFGLTQTGQPYMILDYVPGQTLADALRQYGHVPMDQFIPIFLQVCDALSHAHERSVLHRDVKPSNIMLVANQKNGFDVRIMDFGIAKLMNESESGGQNLTKTGDAIGSPIYMSPEQARGAKMDHRSDLYSLGCVMYECLSNSPPFCGNTALDTMMMHLDTKPLPLSQASMGLKIDPRLEQIVMRLLEKDPADRYQSMDEVRTDLIVLQDPDKTSVLPSVRDSQLVTAIQKARLVEKEKKKLKDKAPLIAIISGVVIFTAACVGVLLWNIPHTEGGDKKQSKPASASSSIGDTDTSDLKAEAEKKIAAEKMKKELKERESEGDKEFAAGDTLPYVDTPRQVLKNQVDKNSSIISVRPVLGGSLSDADMATIKEATLATRIGLTRFPITDSGFDNLKDLKKLEVLDISSTRAKDLKFLANLKALKVLIVAHLKLSPEAFDRIGHLTKLTELNISFTPVTDSDLQKLYNLHDLHLLGLEGCDNLTNLGIDKLRNVLPECVVKEGDTDGNALADNDSIKAKKELADKKIIDKTPMASGSLKKAQAAAATGNWNGANDNVSDSLRFANSHSGDSAVKTAANILKADCQTHFKLWKSAESFYNAGIQAAYRTDVDDTKLPSYYDKLASCYESSAKTESSLQEALNTRAKAEDQFERTEKSMPIMLVDRDKWKQQRQDNLEMMARDNIGMHQEKQATKILDSLVKGCDPADSARKQKYSKLLSSLHAK
jgi:serine/threonine protein kinase